MIEDGGGGMQLLDPQRLIEHRAHAAGMVQDLEADP
jgi:hypothetical protein